jgi:hypothetical protein
MAVGNQVTPRQAGQALAKLVRAEPTARGLWVRAVRDYIELWLVTAPIDPDTVGRLHQAGLTVEDRFPGADLRLHVLNAANYPGIDAATIIPPGAEEIPLRSE